MTLLNRNADLRVWVAKHGLWIVGLALIAACVGVIVMQNGLNYGYDGGYYMSYAENIHAGHGLSLRISGLDLPSLLPGLTPGLRFIQ